jgi:uncharacterized protein YkwD
MTLDYSTARRLVALALLACLFVVGTGSPEAEAATASEIRNTTERKINHARTSRGLRKLRVNATIQQYSQGHARVMAGSLALFHDASFASEMPTGASWAAENVGYVSAGGGAARRVHKAFMDSYLHRKNILARRATHMGIGVVKRDGRIWVVERFADLR